MQIDVTHAAAGIGEASRAGAGCLRLEDLQVEADELHEREREALEALVRARIRGLRGDAARAELRRVREDLECTYAAMGLLAELQRYSGNSAL